MTHLPVSRELLELAYQAVHALAGMKIDGYTEQTCAEFRALLAQPEQASDVPSLWDEKALYLAKAIRDRRSAADALCNPMPDVQLTAAIQVAVLEGMKWISGLHISAMTEKDAEIDRLARLGAFRGDVLVGALSDSGAEANKLRQQLAERDALLREWLDTPLGVSSPAINDLRCKTDYAMSATQPEQVKP